MTRKPSIWPRLVFILVPLLIVLVDAIVLIGERLEPDTEKAVRLVKESNSRKENFTVQQFLYMTVYHRKKSGEPITIEGWRATVSSESASPPITVEFSYVDSSGKQVATWEVDLRVGKVTPANEAALELSWH